jgi:hypothetical protein
MHSRRVHNHVACWAGMMLFLSYVDGGLLASVHNIVFVTSSYLHIRIFLLNTTIYICLSFSFSFYRNLDPPIQIIFK